MHEPILIVGGGLGGLTTGIGVRVLEGAAHFGAIGDGIQFGRMSFMCSIGWT
jgi:hypothetical protein